MTIRSAYFDSVSGDRIYTSDSFSQIFGKAFTDGVIQGFANELAVTNPSGMSISVNTGAAWVQGKLFEVYTSAEALVLTTAHPSLPRMDRLIIRLDYTNRLMSLAILTGTANASPVAPTLTQNTSIWEFSLAVFTLNAGSPFPNGINTSRLVSGVRGFLSGITSFPGASGSDEVVFRSDLLTLFDYAAVSGLNQLNCPTFFYNFPSGTLLDGFRVFRGDLRSNFAYELSTTSWKQLDVPTYSGAWPSSPPVNFRVYRSDRNLEYFWNGGNWVTTELFPHTLVISPDNTLVNNSLSASKTGLWQAPHPDNTSDIYLVDFTTHISSSGAHSSTNYFTVGIRVRNAAASTTATYSADTKLNTVAAALFPVTISVNAVITRANYYALAGDFTASGTPGATFFSSINMHYRLVG